MTNQEENHDELKQLLQVMNERLTSIEDKVEPMYELFNNAKGFDNISKWILISLAKLGVTIGIVYGFFKWLKE